MRKTLVIVLLGLALAPAARAQQVIDRIVARIENDVITESDLNELGRYQKLVDGKEQPEAKRLQELVEQWVVNHEATFSAIRKPTEKELKEAYDQLQKRFGTPAIFEKRLDDLGLTEKQVRDMLERQIFLSRFLEYKFRPEVQVSERQIEEYYRNTLVPELKRTGQSVPPLESVADKIRQVLIERGIDQRAAKWLDEMRTRWKVVMIGGKPSS
jgi:hypothetical protein